MQCPQRERGRSSWRGRYRRSVLARPVRRMRLAGPMRWPTEALRAPHEQDAGVGARARLPERPHGCVVQNDVCVSRAARGAPHLGGAPRRVACVGGSWSASCPGRIVRAIAVNRRGSITTARRRRVHEAAAWRPTAPPRAWHAACLGMCMPCAQRQNPSADTTATAVSRPCHRVPPRVMRKRARMCFHCRPYHPINDDTRAHGPSTYVDFPISQSS